MRDLETVYAEFEKLKTESSEKKLQAKELKDELISMMNDEGKDEVIINGLDGLVKISITYPEKEVLNKKGLSEALGVPQKELSKPQTWIVLTQQGKITAEMIEQFTEVEERMQFGVQEVDGNEDDD